MLYGTTKMSLYLEATRPVLFESEEGDYAYFGLGSSALFSSVANIYWVTAKHVIENQRQDIRSVRVFPSEGSRCSIPFKALLKIEEDPNDSDYADLFIAQVNNAEFQNSGDTILTAQRVEDGLLPSSKLCVGDELFVVGFPGESRAVDYEEFKIKYQRSIYVGKYAGDAIMRYCHKISFRTDHGLNDFNGLSGSPVYKMLSTGNIVQPIVVGILLRGTASSSSGYFVESDVLHYAIQKSEK
jgi:hypothetical protein